MNRKKWEKKIILMILCGVLLFDNVPSVFVNAQKSTVINEKKENYILMTNNSEKMREIERSYSNTVLVNNNTEGRLAQNQTTSLSLTKTQVNQLSKENGVQAIEKDLLVKACSTTGKRCHKKRILEKKSSSSDEWNIRMIHADKAREKVKENKKRRVRVAILDSGVDYNDDIRIVESISLVPGEEDMNPLFIDGTGHGTSVAGLVAAKHNENNVTGVDPYAEIYSIRVLDDNNSSPLSRIIEAIYMSIEANVDIINMSFGVDTYSTVFERAIKSATEHGILVIAAAGNMEASENKSSVSTVQYPAAFNDVIAVGSVDKRGNVVDTSCTGEEIDIVAPGELVRSTGMFGSELVESGTSLAAPQVAGAAALILEKDKKANPDFIKFLLKSSANLYGKKEDYGSGLLDINFALENYDKIKEQYKNSKEESNFMCNQNKILVFNDSGYVKGCWQVDDHTKFLANYSNVKKGARFNDIAKNYGKYYIGQRKDNVSGSIYQISGMDYNPWWHGYFRKNYLNQSFCNYVSAYIYETRMANSITSGALVKSPGDLPNTVIETIKKDINSIPWTGKDKYGNCLYKSMPSVGTKRAFVWGMAIHTLADTFAHSSATFSGSRVKHDTKNNAVDADNTSYLSMRWACAEKAIKLAIIKYAASNKPSGTSNEFSPVKSQGQFKLINIEKYVTSVDGNKNGATYAPYSVYKSYNTNN